MALKFGHITCKLNARYVILVDTFLANDADKKAMKGKDHNVAVAAIQGRIQAWCESRNMKFDTVIKDDLNIRVVFLRNEDLVAFKLGFEGQL